MISSSFSTLLQGEFYGFPGPAAVRLLASVGGVVGWVELSSVLCTFVDLPRSTGQVQKPSNVAGYPCFRRCWRSVQGARRWRQLSTQPPDASPVDFPPPPR